jgi:CheY-like chemotaxis protein
MRSSPLILVVEDDEDTYELYSEFLASAGYSVVGANNGIEAVESALRHLPDLILMDVALPGRSGFEAAKLLKADRRSRHIAILALTGLVQNCFVDLAREVGCDAFLTKPCPLSRMMAEIERLLRLRAPAHTTHPGILLIDDEESVRESLEAVLAEEGFGVVTARNGREALDWLESGERPSLILLDLMMPVMDGWQFRKAQTANAELSRIPTLVLTAVQKDYAIVSPPCGVVHKPVDVPVLLDAVERHLSVARRSAATA